MEIKLQYREVYGRGLYYPNCESSQAIARVGAFKTYTPYQIRQLKLAGWHITILGSTPPAAELLSLEVAQS